MGLGEAQGTGGVDVDLLATGDFDVLYVVSTKTTFGNGLDWGVGRVTYQSVTTRCQNGLVTRRAVLHDFTRAVGRG